MAARLPHPLSSPLKRMLAGVATFLSVCLLAVIGYRMAGWGWHDSIYMVVITIFGVGYGEVQPITSPQLRALTIAVIVLGYAAVLYTMGGFIQLVTEGEINRALGARRMTKGIERLKNHTIVCGFGRVGAMVARKLKEANKSFVIIDTNNERIQEAEEHGYLVIHGSATDDEILQRAGVERAAILASVLSDDATNLFITITAHDLNPDMEIIARGEDPGTEKKLYRCGANKVVLPAAIGAERLADLITRPSAESLLEKAQGSVGLNDELSTIGLHFDELDIQPGSPLVGRTLADIEVKGNRGFLIVALRKSDHTFLLNPDGEAALQAGDTVILLGHQDDLPQLASRYAVKREITYRGAKISEH